MDKERRTDAVVRHGAEGITGASGGGSGDDSLCQGILWELSWGKARGGQRDDDRGSRWGCGGAGGADRTARKLGLRNVGEGGGA